MRIERTLARTTRRWAAGVIVALGALAIGDDADAQTRRDANPRTRHDANRDTAKDAAKHACISAAEDGQRLRDEGAYGRAQSAFAECARDACPTVVAKMCAQWLREVVAAMPTIVIAARDDAGGDVGDVRVLVDGSVVASTGAGTPIAIDPGEHALRFEREGSVASEQRVIVRAGEKNRAIAVTLEPIPALAPAARAEAPSSVSTVTPQAAPADPSERRAAPLLGAREGVALGLVGASAIATGVGIAFGIASRREAETAAGYRAANPSNACVESTSAMCRAWGDAVDLQNRDATWSRVAFVAAGSLAAGAIVTWLVWPRAWIAPAAARGHAGIDLGGSF